MGLAVEDEEARESPPALGPAQCCGDETAARVHGVAQRPALRELRRDGGGQGPSTRSPSSHVRETDPPSRSANRSFGGPSRWPPFTRAALAPRFTTSAEAAASVPSSVDTSQPVSASASPRLGVTRVAWLTRSCSTPSARRSSKGVPSLAASTGSMTMGGRSVGEPPRSRRPSSTMRATSSDASMPSFTASGVTSASSVRICSSTTLGNTGSTSCTLEVS
jgi:hypothetical protein